jgi:hypothetical protein
VVYQREVSLKTYVLVNPFDERITPVTIFSTKVG